MKLSIVVPVFNEERTISQALKLLNDIKINGVEKEIIVVNDGSTDATASAISNFNPPAGGPISSFKTVRHKTNQGKGAAVRTGIKNASGDYVIIQDADLEYNPKEIESLVEPIKSSQDVIVYGTRLRRLPRFSRDERTPQFLLHYIGNIFLSLLTSVLYGQWITDMETCYKLFPKQALNNIDLKAKGFEFEPEITAKFLKKKYKILEIPISTNPRGYEQGKKLNTFRDGFKALWTLLKYRIIM
jgi:dolichol-phosphate mannosyltransferase